MTQPKVNEEENIWDLGFRKPEVPAAVDCDAQASACLPRPIDNHAANSDRMSAYMCVRISACMCVRMSVCMCIRMSAYMCVRISAYMCVTVNACMCVQQLLLGIP